MVKKRIVFLLLVVFAQISVFAGGFNNLLPKGVEFSLVAPDISRFIAKYNGHISKRLPVYTQEKILSIVNNIKKNTGVNLLDVDSQKKLGIDVSRSGAFVKYPSLSKDMLVLLIPVSNESLAPLKLIELLNSTKNIGEFSLAPVITPYKHKPIFQISRTLFCTATDGYLIVATAGELVRKIIDAGYGLVEREDVLYPLGDWSKYDLVVSIPSIAKNSKAAKLLSTFGISQDVFQFVNDFYLGIDFQSKKLVVKASALTKDNNVTLPIFHKNKGDVLIEKNLAYDLSIWTKLNFSRFNMLNREKWSLFEYSMVKNANLYLGKKLFQFILNNGTDQSNFYMNKVGENWLATVNFKPEVNLLAKIGKVDKGIRYIRKKSNTNYKLYVRGVGKSKVYIFVTKGKVVITDSMKMGIFYFKNKVKYKKISKNISANSIFSLELKKINNHIKSLALQRYIEKFNLLNLDLLFQKNRYYLNIVLSK